MSMRNLTASLVLAVLLWQGVAADTLSTARCESGALRTIQYITAGMR